MPMAELEQQIRKIVRSLARENPLTPEDIAKREDVHGLSTWSRKHVLRAIVQATKDLRARGQLGKLRAALLIGTTLLGDSFLTSAQRAGTLLGDVARKESFGRFLDELTAETAAVSSPEWKLLNDRLKSYRAYQRVVGALSA